MAFAKGGSVLNINFVASSPRVVARILKKFYPSEKVEQMLAKGEVRKDIYGKGYNFSPPNGGTESFEEFLDEMVAGSELELLSIDDSGSTNGDWLKYKIIPTKKR